jgi:hypothetical protein
MISLAAIANNQIAYDNTTLEYLIQFCETYPYCQVSRILLAKARFISGKVNEGTHPPSTMIYVPDKKQFDHFLNEPVGILTEKQQRQQDIINRFLRENPRISSPKEVTGLSDQNDQNDISGETDSDLVSETLAEILLKQGKNNKALGIYEKLCLKYPEKSSYFAKKIEHIKEQTDNLSKS